MFKDSSLLFAPGMARLMMWFHNREGGSNIHCKICFHGCKDGASRWLSGSLFCTWRTSSGTRQSFTTGNCYNRKACKWCRKWMMIPAHLVAKTFQLGFLKHFCKTAHRKGVAPVPRESPSSRSTRGWDRPENPSYSSYCCKVIPLRLSHHHLLLPSSSSLTLSPSLIPN